MVAVLERRFEAWVPLTKATEDGEDWIVSGPVADVDVPDYDGETLEKAGVFRGLAMHAKLGGHIDYEHQYPIKKDPKWLIGQRVEVTEVDGKPWMSVRLHKAGPGAELAKKVWEAVKAGVHMGFSIWGAGKRHPNDKKRIVDTEIRLVTIAPSPKGFNQFLQAGAPPAGLYAIAKALTGDGVVVGLDDDWTELEKSDDWPMSRRDKTPKKYFGDPDAEAFPVETQEDLEHAAELLHHAPDPEKVKRRLIGIARRLHLELPESWREDMSKALGGAGYRCEKCDRVCDERHCPHCGGEAELLEKALTTGSGIVYPGTTGGAALRGQFLKGTPESTTYGDPDSKKRRKKKRTAAIEKALSDRGIRNPRALARRVISHIDSRRNT